MEKVTDFNNACGACAAYSNCTGCGGKCGGNNPEPKQIVDNEIIEDVESGEFENFLTARSRERAKYRKQLLSMGKNKEEAKQLAFEKYPKQTLKETIANVKGNLSNIRTQESPEETVVSETVVSETDTENQNPQNNEGSTNSKSNDDANKAGVKDNTMNWKPFVIWGAVGVAVAIGGYFAYVKWIKK